LVQADDDWVRRWQLDVDIYGPRVADEQASFRLPAATGISLPGNPPADMIVQRAVSEKSTAPHQSVEIMPQRSFEARIVRTKLKGRRGYRRGVRVIRLSSPNVHVASEVPALKSPTGPLSLTPSSRLQEQYTAGFTSESLDPLVKAAKLHAATGSHLPAQLRELFEGFANPRDALKIANTVRRAHGQPTLEGRMNQVQLRRAIAQMREQLYVELVSALSLPSAPQPLSDNGDSSNDEVKPTLSLTPYSLNILAGTLPKSFPTEKNLIKTFLADDQAAYGEKGSKVVWEGGVGRMLGKDGPGFRGNVTGKDDLCHIFVDQ
jgi:hypothetical protein